MRNFFGWQEPCPRMAVDSWPSNADVPATPTLHDMLQCLSRLCQGPDAHPFVKPLGNTFIQLGDGARKNCSSNSLAALGSAFAAAIEFLSASETPARHLEFALNTHKEKAATYCFIHTITDVCPPTWRSQWVENAEEFVARCREVWELHAYFVFLDIKGDRVLFEQTAHLLCRALGCSMRSFVGCLAHSRPWVEDMLRSLARQDLRPLLQRLHEAALRKWRTSWEERVRLAPERSRVLEEMQHGDRFWESYFTHLFKITWPDFVEAFEHFYLLGRCPVDLVQQLRLRIDPASKHQVSRSCWQSLLHQHGRIWSVVDAMLAEVLDDISARVYRAEPLRPTYRNHGGCCTVTLEFSLPPEDTEPLSVAAASSSTNSPPSPHALRAGGRSDRSPPPEDPKPAPWFPFVHSTSEDGDMAIPTPHDMRLRQGPEREDGSQGNSHGQQPVTSWDDFCGKLCDQSRPWWGVPNNGSNSEADILNDDSVEPLRIAALRAVSSCIAYTHRALVFRVVSGDLAHNRPILELPKKDGSGKDDVGEKEMFPSLVVMANGTRFSGVTKFGRTSSRRTLLPDYPMTEPIASRSHFNVIYDQEADRYCLMDAGSKWGTFVKIRSSVSLSCGDWIRVGGVEFIIHFCGGACSCSKHHAHYRLHSLRLLREHQACSQVSIPRIHPFENGHKQRAGLRGFKSACDLQQACEIGLCERSSSMPVLYSSSSRSDPELNQEDEREDGSSEDEDSPLQDELWLLLNSRRPRGWTPASSRLCQRSAMPYAGPPRGTPELSMQHCCAASSSSSQRRTSTSNRQVPIAPLELDFISGPRMGEKIVLCERVCTLGRGEGNTIQVNDAQLASVSRVHCIFEYIGNRWYMRDNGSTNGTWRRLSCILEPSEPISLHHGVSIQAGVHEFMVEECDMRQSWFPSTAFASFEELCEQERHEQQQQQVTRDVDSSRPLEAGEYVGTNRSDHQK